MGRDAIETVVIIAVSGGVAVMLLTTVTFMVYLIVKAARGGGSKKSKQADMEETQLIQEIHHGLTRMEDRVEALETLLLKDERGKRERDFDRELRKES